MEKNVQIALLFSIYRNMLTDRQAESVDLYYNEDLSLSEIGEHMGITRQGVRDNMPSISFLMWRSGWVWRSVFWESKRNCVRLTI